LSDERTVPVIDAVATMDRDDPSIGEVRFLTDEGWRIFQLPRIILKRLARELQDGLQATASDQPKG